MKLKAISNVVFPVAPRI